MEPRLRPLALLLLAAALPACSSLSSPPGAGLEDELGAASQGSLSECQALYAAPQAGVSVDPELSYGSPGRLILSFVDDAVKARAVDWMGANLGLSLGSGLGVLQNLPMAAVETVITDELVDRLVAEWGPQGLLSIWQDRPLEYFLDGTVPAIGADTARQAFGMSGAGVGVAVIDSGIDATHPDLQGSVARNVKIVGLVTEQPLGGYLYVDMANTDLTSGHGTHVAGTIAGSGAASSGRYAGVAPGAHLVGVGAGDLLFILHALEGFDFVMRPEVREEHGVRIISNSWGTTGRFDPYHPVSLAIKRAYDAGLLVVFAAGNEGPGDGTLNPYSASPCAISVAAGDLDGRLADFSSRGLPGDALHHPDITAPGVDVTAARALTGLITLPDLPSETFYSTISGTSMATPHVSGTLALMLEADPGLTLEEALAILTGSARPMHDADGGPYAEHEAGAGYLDAYEAVRLAVRGNRDRFELTAETVAVRGYLSVLTSYDGLAEGDRLSRR